MSSRMPAENNAWMKLTKVYMMLMVADMGRAVAFYRDTFGLQPTMQTPFWSELAFGDAVVALHSGGSGTGRETGLGLEVDDLDAACAAVRTNGGQVVREPQDRPEERIRLATMADTEGNQFSLGQALAG
jgi:predicted enzyme related to lactoylglutathione lyase